MFEEVFRIIFDRRHIKDVRLWVLLVLLISEVASFWCYDKYVIRPIKDRQDRQGLRIRQIIKVGKFAARIEALPQEEKPRGNNGQP